MIWLKQEDLIKVALVLVFRLEIRFNKVKLYETTGNSNPNPCNLNPNPIPILNPEFIENGLGLVLSRYLGVMLNNHMDFTTTVKDVLYSKA